MNTAQDMSRITPASFFAAIGQVSAPKQRKPAMPVRRNISDLSYIGAGVFRATLSCGHVQEFAGSTRRLPRTAICEHCK